MQVDDQLQRIITKLEAREPIQQLLPQSVWDEELDNEIADIRLPDKNRTAALALRAALHLCNDSLDRSHAFAQQIEHDRTGAYWHGIMHRMEGDYWNAKYWFRQAGSHPALLEVQKAAGDCLAQTSMPEGEIGKRLREAVSGSLWNAASFVDAVELQESGKGTEQSALVLERLQQCEMRALLRYTLDWVYL
ncbi:hypothetical protein [Paenibacillus sp. GCM10027626]|uniref:hypothetical protein n=1 Tax=Paenibacillus sp. GCM10027626 TaxID=3273411 RepID=UPI0036268C36